MTQMTLRYVRRQEEIAIDEADVILFVVDPGKALPPLMRKLESFCGVPPSR